MPTFIFIHFFTEYNKMACVVLGRKGNHAREWECDWGRAVNVAQASLRVFGGEDFELRLERGKRSWPGES